MTDEDLRELRHILLTTSAFNLKGAMVQWIDEILTRHKSAPEKTVVLQPVKPLIRSGRRRTPE